MVNKMVTRKRTTRVKVCTGPDWSNLPNDTVQQISEKIIFREQYDHLRLVCQQWRHACAPHPRHLISQTPWLSLLRYPSDSTLSFYDFSRSKTHDFDLPNIVDKRVVACSRGWLLLSDNKELSLINPITGEVNNCVPSLAAPPTILEYARNEKTKDPPLSSCGYCSAKVILTSSPSDVNCIMVAQFRDLWELGFCRVGDKAWTILKLTEHGQHGRQIIDFVYRNRLVYAMSHKGRVTVYDLRDLSRNLLIGDLSCGRRQDGLYLAIGVGELDGVPLLVRHVRRTSGVFEVYRYANERSRSRWRRVKNIGNFVLFIVKGPKCEMVPICNNQLNGWEGNSICYCVTSDLNRKVTIKMVNIENGSRRKVLVLSSPGSGYLSFFTPSLG